MSRPLSEHELVLRAGTRKRHLRLLRPAALFIVVCFVAWAQHIWVLSATSTILYLLVLTPMTVIFVNHTVSDGVFQDRSGRRRWSSGALWGTALALEAAVQLISAGTLYPSLHRNDHDVPVIGWGSVAVGGLIAAAVVSGSKAWSNGRPASVAWWRGLGAGVLLGGLLFVVAVVVRFDHHGFMG